MIYFPPKSTVGSQGEQDLLLGFGNTDLHAIFLKSF